MKISVALILVGLCSACAPREEPKTKRSAPAAKPSAACAKPSNVRTSEAGKAYAVGRYRDPSDPDVMHERHTVYRREQAADWNFLPDAPYALPLGPVVARSQPSASYYVTAERERMNAQQRAYAAALLEQNRALKKRLETSDQDGDRVKSLEREIEQLKRQLDAESTPVPADPAPTKPEPTDAEAWDDFSRMDPPLPPWEAATASSAPPRHTQSLTSLHTQTP